MQLSRFEINTKIFLMGPPCPPALKEPKKAMGRRKNPESGFYRKLGREYKAGASVRELAAKYGINRSNVYGALQQQRIPRRGPTAQQPEGSSDG